MSKTGRMMRSDALGDFKALEDRVGRVLKALTEARNDRETANEKLREARSQIQALESEIRDLRKERKTVRTRVQDMIREITELERERLKAGEKRVV